MLEDILDRFPNEPFLVADGFNDAIIGVELGSMRLIYSVKKCILTLMLDMSEEDAMEYFEYNVRGAYVGEQTPIWCEDNF